MDPNEYREQVEQEVEAAGNQPAAEPASQDVAAVWALGRSIVTDDEVFEAQVARLGDREVEAEVRMAILTAVQRQSFVTPAYRERSAAWTEALRGLSDDPDADLRLCALGLLASQGDGATQDRLLEGLRDPQKALLPPDTALLLLANDIHAEVYLVARRLAEAPPDEDTRIAALRVLSADAQSAPFFDTVLQDTTLSTEARRTALAALHSLDPEALVANAASLIKDPGADQELVAASLTALSLTDTPLSAPLGERVAELAKADNIDVAVAAGLLRERLDA